MNGEQSLILDESTVALHDGELEKSSWVYAWTVKSDPAVVVYVGATGLPPVVRSWLHVHDDNPDIGRIRTQHPELLRGNVTVRAFQIRPDLDRQEVKNHLMSELAEQTTTSDDATPEQRCAHQIAAILSNGQI